MILNVKDESETAVYVSYLIIVKTSHILTSQFI